MYYKWITHLKLTFIIADTTNFPVYEQNINNIDSYSLLFMSAMKASLWRLYQLFFSMYDKMKAPTLKVFQQYNTLLSVVSNFGESDSD